MKTEIQIEECKSPFCVIHAATDDEKIRLLQEKISLLGNDGETVILNGWDGDFCLRILPKDIYRIYSFDKKVFIETEKETFLFKMRLYEFEEICEKCGWTEFLRISNTDIVNMNHVKNLDMSLSGIIKINLTNQTQQIVSRRYMSKIKNSLILNKA